MIKILFLGEIVGIPAIRKMKKALKEVVEENAIDLVIANDDGASDGYGVLKKSSCELYNAGIKILTGGDNIFNKKDVRELLKLPFQIRPFNLPNSLGGKGYTVCRLNENINIGVVNILGRINFNKIYSFDPFHAASLAVDKLKDTTNIIIVDFHGGATSEIHAMHWFLSGKVSCVLGTNLRVLTSDNRILGGRTAVVTGCGFCGVEKSICGLKPEIEINKIKNGQFIYSKIEKENIFLQGVIIEIDENTGNALKIDLFKKSLGSQVNVA